MIEIKNRQRHYVEQGTPEWFELRRGKITASTMTTICGHCGARARQDLVREWATGVARPVTPYMQKLFDDGHRLEAAARRKVEVLIGLKLEPAVFTCEIDGIEFLASLDGLTPDGEGVWEHKTLNKVLRQAAEDEVAPPKYASQMEVQLACSGAIYVMLEASNDEEERRRVLEYFSNEDYLRELVAEAKKFLLDVLEYEESDDFEYEAEAYKEADAAYKAASEALAAARDALIAKAGENADGHGLKITTSTRKGSIDYPRYIKDNNLVVGYEYRKPSTSSTRITIAKEEGNDE